MTEAKRIMVAMSGGVDSSVAAALLIEQGYQVQGMTMRLWHEEPDGQNPTTEPAERARSVCQLLGIAHHEVDLRQVFYQQIVQYFIQEYMRGRTPNPCVRCNRLLKFATLLGVSQEMGCQGLATGHYARISHDDAGWHLLCATDQRKDQSYFLYNLGQEQLSQVLFPLGAWTKAQVREKARALGLPVAEQAESQDICFLRDRDYRRFLAQHFDGAVQPGPIYDSKDRILGQHRGLAFYTVGQREGLGIAAATPYYVISLDKSRNALIVGHSEELGRRALLADEMHYIADSALPDGYPVEAKIRYRAQRAAAHVWAAPGARTLVTFEHPLRDITPGQAVVLYKGPQVLGGGIIAESVHPDSAQDDPAHTAR